MFVSKDWIRLGALKYFYLCHQRFLEIKTSVLNFSPGERAALNSSRLSKSFMMKTLHRQTKKRREMFLKKNFRTSIHCSTASPQEQKNIQSSTERSDRSRWKEGSALEKAHTGLTPFAVMKPPGIFLAKTPHSPPQRNHKPTPTSWTEMNRYWYLKEHFFWINEHSLNWRCGVFTSTAALSVVFLTASPPPSFKGKSLKGKVQGKRLFLALSGLHPAPSVWSQNTGEGSASDGKGREINTRFAEPVWL